MTAAAAVTPEQCQAARWVLGVAERSEEPLGEQPGSFTTRLIQALFSADSVNAAKVARVYPEIVEAVLMYKAEEGGHTVLRYRAGMSR